MKKQLFIKSLFVLAITTFFITSCNNFLNGSKLIDDLTEEIDFANGSCANVTYTLDQNKGILEPSGNRKYYVGGSENLKFIPSNNIEFNEWVAYDQDNKALGPDVINFENKYDPYTKVTFCKPCTNVRIVPETYDLSKQLDGDYKFDFIEVLNDREETIYKMITDENGNQKVEVENCFDYKGNSNEPKFYFKTADDDINLRCCTDKIYINVKITDSNSQLKYLILDTGNINKAKKIKLNKIEKNVFGYSGFIDLTELEINRYLINFELEDIKGNVFENEDSQENNSDSKSILYVNPNVTLSDFNLYMGKIYDDNYLYFNLSNNLLNFENRISKVYFRGKIYSNDNLSGNDDYLTDNFDNGLSCEVYSGTDINNLVKQNIVLENYEKYDSFKLPIENIDFNKDNYVKVVVKNRMGKEKFEICKLNASPVLKFKYFDGENYNFSLKTSIDTYETKTFNFYKGNFSEVVVDEATLKPPLKTIECKNQVNSFTLSKSEIDNEDDLFAIETEYLYSSTDYPVYGLYSNSVEIIQNGVTPYNENYFTSFEIKTGEKSSDKYTFYVTVDRSYKDYLDYMKENGWYSTENLIFLDKDKNILYEIDSEKIYNDFIANENLIIHFDLSYKNMLSFADNPIKLYAIDSENTIHEKNIYFNEVKYDDKSPYQNKDDFLNKLNSIDITPPYCTDLNIKAFEDHLEMDLPQDNFDKGINQYNLYTYLYWIPFKDEWEGLELNQINVLDEHYDDYNSIDEVVSVLFDDFVYVHYFRKYSSPDTKINVPFAKLINDKYLLVMRAIDENGNEGYAPVLIFENANDIFKVNYLSVNINWFSSSISCNDKDYTNCIIKVGNITSDYKQGGIDDYVASDNFNADTDTRVRVDVYCNKIENDTLYHQSQFCGYYLRSDPMGCKLKDYLVYKNGTYQFLLDKECWVHLLISKTDFGDDISYWENHVDVYISDMINHTGLVGYKLYTITPESSAISFTDINEIPSGYNYILIVFYADGTYEILEKGRKIQ